ncbi:HNH endonuclease family protein, partial [Helicobacter pylori]
FMLLHVLANKQNEEDKQETRKYLYQKGELKLEVAPQNQSFFKTLLEAAEKGSISHCEKDADTEGKQNLFEVLKAILDKVSKLSEEGVNERLEALLEMVLMRLEEPDPGRAIRTFLDKVSKLSEEGVNERLEALLEMVLMRLEEPDPGRAIRTFQSVNDRGLPLLLLDKLKSLLIYYSNTFCDGKMGLDQFINDHFGEIFKIFAKIKKSDHISSVGGFDEGDIFRYHAGSQRFDGIEFLGHYRTSTDNTYEKLKAELKEIKKSTLESFIQSYVSDLKNFYQAFLDLLSEIDTNPTTLKVMLINRINPLFFNSLIRLKINNELDDETLKLFAKTDIVFFKATRNLASMAYNLINAYLEKGKEGLKSKMIAQCRNDIGMASLKLVNNASNSSCFHYVFFEKNCQEMGLADLKKLIPGKQFSQEKEHIIPINLLELDNEIEIQKLGFEDKKDLENYIDTYGNLISLESPLNRNASDKDLYEKDEIYKSSEVPFNRCFNVKGFNKKILIERNNEMEKWLINTFFKDFAAH